MKKHRNIPFFVPHAGCPNCCVFCSQTKITGRSAVQEDSEAEKRELASLLDSIELRDETDSRIAFFGGSFTAIPRDRMVGLLETAQEYIKKGVASGIRISTRPDCVEDEVLELLKSYGVTDIELGIQSTDDGVLALSGRGHTAKQSFDACARVLKHGFSLCGQMMVGLPASDREKEIRTARDIVSMGAAEARIYPTAVFEGTELFRMTERGEYIPLTTESAVERTADCFEIFLSADVRVLRIGLHASESLAKAPFGATHPAIGELVKGRVLANRIADGINELIDRHQHKYKNIAGVEISVSKKQISMLFGHGGAEEKRLRALFPRLSILLTVGDNKEFCPTVRIRRV